MKNVRTVKVFVEVDPSHEIFKGFRLDRNFFTDFAAHLLEEVVRRLPVLVTIHFETWPSVSWEGPLMEKLIGLAKAKRKRVVGTGLQQSCDEKLVQMIIED